MKVGATEQYSAVKVEEGVFEAAKNAVHFVSSSLMDQFHAASNQQTLRGQKLGDVESGMRGFVSNDENAFLGSIGITLLINPHSK